VCPHSGIDWLVTYPLRRVDDLAKYFKLSALIAGSIALWWQPLALTLKLALSTDAYTHILLIVPLSIALLYFERPRVPSLASRVDGWVGFSWVLRYCSAASRFWASVSPLQTRRWP